MRARDELPREPEELAPEAVRPAETGLLELQRAAGNRAVAAMLARAPSEEKAATMTAGLGDEIGVIPIDSFSWGSMGNPGNVGKGKAEVREVSITFGTSPVSARIAQAAADGSPIKAAFISTTSMTVDFSDVLLSSYLENERGSQVTLNFAGMKFRT